MSDMGNDDEKLVPAPGLGDRVYDRLRSDVLGGVLAPGERLSVTALADRFGVSAMPVRDALRRLEQDGLVETSARRWTRVVQVDLNEFAQLVPVLSLLEQYALTSAGPLAAGQLAELERINERFGEALDRGEVRAIVDADVSFHDALIRLAGSAPLERAARDAKARIRVIRIQSLQSSGRGDSFADHERIIEALRRGDAAEAASVLDTNWRRGLAQLDAR